MAKIIQSGQYFGLVEHIVGLPELAVDEVLVDLHLYKVNSFWSHPVRFG